MCSKAYPAADDARAREVGLRIVSWEADEQSGAAPCRAICGGANRSGAGGAKGTKGKQPTAITHGFASFLLQRNIYA